MEIGEEERYAAGALFTLALHLTQVLWPNHSIECCHHFPVHRNAVTLGSAQHLTYTAQYHFSVRLWAVWQCRTIL